ncbi:8-amino-7-oxononanoate synthase [Thaumasiovibrio sp. DFM-14]|uniref:8-amino-7-oxononanoate synthase n=1 Tax=Thaumasiovibrio sp. DFM-14 TaxID=3384792 RepID=UPI0039A26795
MKLKQRWQQRVAERHSQGLLRGHDVNQLSQRGVVNFSSNDYLGLSQATAVKQAFCEGIAQYGSGSGASPLVTGYFPAHRELEAALCDWLNQPRALLFSSGFAANQAALFSLLDKGDVLLQDRLNHASLIEAGLLSNATQWRFRHNDMHDLSRLCQRHSAEMVVTEGVFSMDGDMAPLPDIAKISSEANSVLMVDDAHAIGVVGEQGEGSASQISPDITLVTFGKALGVAGAALVCSEAVYDYLLQFARHYTYSTAMPPAQALAVYQSIRLAQSERWRREKLASLSALFYQHLPEPLRSPYTATPIKPVIMENADQALAVSQQLLSGGFKVSAIRPPTVPTSRLRITLSCDHQPHEVIALCRALDKATEAIC